MILTTTGLWKTSGTMRWNPNERYRRAKIPRAEQEIILSKFSPKKEEKTMDETKRTDKEPK
jgi:hypothetical protein